MFNALIAEAEGCTDPARRAELVAQLLSYGIDLDGVHDGDRRDATDEHGHAEDWAWAELTHVLGARVHFNPEDL